MRVDIDKLEALEKRAIMHPEGGQIHDWEEGGGHTEDCVGCDYETALVDAFPELVREVMELRGIAEAARAVIREWPDVDVEDFDNLAARLARYDAGVTP
jgi:hypothetical protein